MKSFSSSSHWRWLQQRPQPVCGTFLERSLRMTTGCTGTNCDRTYYLYLPCNSQGPLPLFFSIHCYGCTPGVMQHWSNEADQYGFALVIPQGIQRAFNAKVCCGEPLHDNVDDKAFLKQIQAHLLEQPENNLSAQAIYAMGWSNGGYMVSYAAELFRAIAPISGYQYEDFGVEHPVGLFLHHAADDHMVRATGCCTDSSMPKCCCGISDASPDTCLSASGYVEEFGATVNDCGSWQEITIRGIDCYTGVGCQKNTTYCIHPEGGHFGNMQSAISMKGGIMDFFARDACQITDSTWDEKKLQCNCPSEGMGRYCLAKPGSVVEEDGMPSSASNPEWNAVIVPLLITLILSAVALPGFQRYRANRKKYSGFEVAPTLELGSVDGKAIQ